MNNPWDIKTDDARKSDSLPTFIIFCEDKVSEPLYFKYFETEKIKVNCIKNQKSMMTNVLNAICYCQELGTLTQCEGEYCIEEGTQIWCVYDRDKEETQEKVRTGNVSFDEAIETAERKGIKMAWSNDAFELWVLLHFEDVSLDDTRREVYYDRLTEIFRNLPNPNEDLIRVLSHNTYSYKKDFKHENNFKNIVRNEIIGKTSDAIGRARILEENFQANDTLPHQKSPCTLVHHLVEELILLGEKEV